MHLAIRLSGFKEADATVVGIADQLCELVLSQLALNTCEFIRKIEAFRTINPERLI